MARPGDPGIVVRPLPELEIALAYGPADRVLSCLNLNAWAVIELCDGRASLEPDYQRLTGRRLTPAEASRQLRLALSQLHARGLIEPTGPATTGPAGTGPARTGPATREPATTGGGDPGDTTAR